MIPRAELLDGHTEAIGDGDQRIGAAHFVTLPGRETATGGDRNDEFIAGFERLGRRHVIEGCDRGGVDVERVGDLI